MIPTEIFTAVGKITVSVIGFYAILIIPYAISVIVVLVTESILIRVNNYIFKKFGGTAKNPPVKYEDETMWLYRKTVVPVRKFRRWYMNKAEWYDRNILYRLPGL